MTNMLIDALPDEVEIDGKMYPINCGHTIGIQFELLMLEDMPDSEKLGHALTLYYPEQPENVSEAIKKILWFYRCGKEESNVERIGGANRGPAYSFEQDDRMIYAAFLEQYGIDLTDAKAFLHWWQFCALLESLSDKCKFSQVVGYRTMEIPRKMPKHEKDFYLEMKRRYAIKQQHVKPAISLIERNQRMIDYISRRQKETGVMKQ